jgi:hypothetical protein
MIQKAFAEKAAEILKNDSSVLGLAVAGSWLTNEIDEFSDLDLILVTRERISNNKGRMLEYAKTLGQLLSAFTGEHVNEPRLLICLYDDPLLHVDIKFLTIEEFDKQIEIPVIISDEGGQLRAAVNKTKAEFPYPEYQWIEDRFWTWIHYVLLKIGRGEYLEALDFFGFLRMVVFGPLLHIKNGNLPRGVRKVETQLADIDLVQLKRTIASYDKQSLIDAVENSVKLYQSLRNELFNSIAFQRAAEEKVIAYLQYIKLQKSIARPQATPKFK